MIYSQKIFSNTVLCEKRLWYNMRHLREDYRGGRFLTGVKGAFPLLARAQKGTKQMKKLITWFTRLAPKFGCGEFWNTPAAGIVKVPPRLGNPHLLERLHPGLDARGSRETPVRAYLEFVTGPKSPQAFGETQRMEVRRRRAPLRGLPPATPNLRSVNTEREETRRHGDFWEGCAA